MFIENKLLLKKFGGSILDLLSLVTWMTRNGSGNTGGICMKPEQSRNLME